MLNPILFNVITYRDHFGAPQRLKELKRVVHVPTQFNVEMALKWPCRNYTLRFGFIELNFFVLIVFAC